MAVMRLGTFDTDICHRVESQCGPCFGFLHKIPFDFSQSYSKYPKKRAHLIIIHRENVEAKKSRAIESTRR